jgi:hypothetical protein
MPDGSSGVLAAALDGSQGSMRRADFGGSGATATISNFFSNQTPDVVLGDQGVHFMSDGNKVVAADVASGNEKWRWQPTDNSSVTIMPPQPAEVCS